MGEYLIDSISGTGAKIKLDFLRPGGTKTGHLLPPAIAVDNIADVQAGCIDAANPCIFMRSEDVGIDGTILPNDFNKLSQKLRWLEEIREVGKIAMGMAKSKSEVPRTIPRISIVSPPYTPKSLSGSVIEGSPELYVQLSPPRSRILLLSNAYLLLSLIQTRFLSVIPGQCHNGFE